MDVDGGIGGLANCSDLALGGPEWSCLVLAPTWPRRDFINISVANASVHDVRC